MNSSAARRAVLPLVLALGMATTTASVEFTPPPRPPESLDELLQWFPPVQKNEEAAEVERLAAELGISFASMTRFPSGLTAGGGPRAVAPAVDRERARAWSAAESEIGKYVSAQLLATTGPPARPPDKVLVVLRGHEATLNSLCRKLIEGRPPRWDRNVRATVVERQFQDTSGFLTLERVLIARALERGAAGDTKAAEETLEACWILHAALFEQPDLFSQLLAIGGMQRQAGALRHLDDLPAVWSDRLRNTRSRERMLAMLRIEVWSWTELDPTRDSLEKPSVVESLLGAVVRPWFRFSGRQSARIWTRSLTRFDSTEPICGADLRKFKEDLAAEFSWWNRVGPSLIDLPSTALGRVGRLEVDCEMTAKILDLKAARRANGGLWPVRLDGIEDSRACSNSRWVYRVDDAGEVWLTLDPAPVWPDETPNALILPTQWTSGRASASTPPGRTIPTTDPATRGERRAVGPSPSPRR